MKLKSGSSLLLVLSITSILSILGLGLWYKSSLLLDLVLQEEQYYKNFYLMESFLDYGVQYAKENFAELIASKDLSINPVVFSLNLEENLDNSLRNLFVEVTIKRLKEKDKFEDKFFVSAILKNIKTLRQIFKLSCKLQKFEVKNEAKNNSKKLEYFVENFTIGNFI